MVTVSHLSLTSYHDGLARVRVRGSAGFYVRSLAHELGVRLGCGAHLESLRRVRAGTFVETAAVALETVEAEGRGASRWLIALDELLPHVPAAVLNERGVRLATHGNALAPDDVIAYSGGPRYPGVVQPAVGPHVADEVVEPGPWRLLNDGGMLLGIAEMRAGGVLHPVIVLV